MAGIGAPETISTGFTQAWMGACPWDGVSGVGTVTSQVSFSFPEKDKVLFNYHIARCVFLGQRWLAEGLVPVAGHGPG